MVQPEPTVSNTWRKPLYSVCLLTWTSAIYVKHVFMSSTKQAFSLLAQSFHYSTIVLTFCSLGCHMMFFSFVSYSTNTQILLQMSLLPTATQCEKLWIRVNIYKVAINDIIDWSVVVGFYSWPPDNVELLFELSDSTTPSERVSLKRKLRRFIAVKGWKAENECCYKLW